ncbi:hypothetical protein SDC9_174327 [bioreactor metagenome]|uniref:Uncharacterized protein n=1 Tax=bioreactor metagenome TaxID=1076179 RepID=A0A645GIU9_9ZZZZ
MAGAGAPGKVGNALGGGKRTSLFGEADNCGVEIGTGKIHFLGPLSGHRLAGDDAVHGAGLNRGHQRTPFQTDHLQLPAIGLAELLGHHDVIAVSIFVGILNGHCAVGIVGLTPVIGSISALHSHGKHAVFHTGG